MAKERAVRLREVALYYTGLLLMGAINGGWPLRWSHWPLWLTLVVASTTLLVIPWIISRVTPARDWSK